MRFIQIEGERFYKYVTYTTDYGAVDLYVPPTYPTDARTIMVATTHGGNLVIESVQTEKEIYGLLDQVWHEGV